MFGWFSDGCISSVKDRYECNARYSAEITIQATVNSVRGRVIDRVLHVSSIVLFMEVLARYHEKR